MQIFWLLVFFFKKKKTAVWANITSQFEHVLVSSRYYFCFLLLTLATQLYHETWNSEEEETYSVTQSHRAPQTKHHRSLESASQRVQLAQHPSQSPHCSSPSIPWWASSTLGNSKGKQKLLLQQPQRMKWFNTLISSHFFGVFPLLLFWFLHFTSIYSAEPTHQNSECQPGLREQHPREPSHLVAQAVRCWLSLPETLRDAETYRILPILFSSAFRQTVLIS